MITQVIIFNQDNGNISIIYPSPEALAQYGIKAIANKDVLHGKRYAIRDVAMLPPGLPETWKINDADLTDGVGAESNEFPQPPQPPSPFPFVDQKLTKINKN